MPDVKFLLRFELYTRRKNPIHVAEKVTILTTLGQNRQTYILSRL